MGSRDGVKIKGRDGWMAERGFEGKKGSEREREKEQEGKEKD